jgi:hypothetical protein
VAVQIYGYLINYSKNIKEFSVTQWNNGPMMKDIM